MDALQETAQRAADLERGADWEGALATYDQVFAAARAAGSVRWMADATRGTARMLRELCRLDEAQEQAELSIEIATRAELAYAAARAVNILGTVHYVRGDIHNAADLYESALESARELREDDLILAACVNLGVVANIRGDLRAAFAFYLECIASAVRTSNAQASVFGYNNLGMLAADVREWMQADVLFHRALELADEIGDATITTTLLLNRAEPLIQVGDLDAAERVLDRAEAMAERIQNVREMAEAARFRGMLACRRGDEAGASGHLGRSLLLATRAGLRLERAEALEQMALLHHDAGRSEAAHTHLAEACSEFFAAGATRDCGRCRELLSAWAAPAEEEPAPDAAVPTLRIAGAA